jgi:hypothetical protein
MSFFPLLPAMGSLAVCAGFIRKSQMKKSVTAAAIAMEPSTSLHQ